MKALILTAALLLVSSQQMAIAQLYIWTDKNGVKHYTNTAPPPEAMEIQEEAEAAHVGPTPEQRARDLKEKYKESIKDHTQKLRESIKKRTTARKASRPYRVSSLSVDPDGEHYIRVTGRIEGGESCKRLTVNMFLHSNKGGIAHLVFVVENVGGSGSRLFESREYVWDHTEDEWKLGNVYFTCSQH